MFDFLAHMTAALAGGLFARVGDGLQLLRGTALRRQLMQLIGAKPGIYGSELARASGEPWGTVQYHLSLLDKHHEVTSVESGRKRRFFPPDMDVAHARLLAIMGQGRRTEIASFICDHPGARQVDICAALEVTRKTFRSSIAPLVEEGLVQERKGLQSSRYFPQPPLAGLIPEDPPGRAHR